MRVGFKFGRGGLTSLSWLFCVIIVELISRPTQVVARFCLWVKWHVG